jgi:uncharacterized protein DUF4416
MIPHEADPSLLVVAAFSRHAEALAWAQARLQEEYGRLAIAGGEFDFHHTSYYEPAMGRGLRKQLMAFEKLVGTDRLADIKLSAIRLEDELAASGRFPEPRPLNLDPGLLQLGKFMLATTKDKGHRIYLGKGIYAEVTLFFQAGMFEPWPWTYADYREPAVRQDLAKMREYYRSRLALFHAAHPENP